MKQLIKNFLPPIIVEWLNALRPDYGWKGSYRSWGDAKAASGGYDADNIFEQVSKATMAVKNGEAEYERDGVLFDHIEYSWSLLTALFMATSLAKTNSVSVVDFGGGLGSSYYQNRKFLSFLENVRWNVIEQDGFVDTGRKLLEDEKLRFYYSIDECLANTKPNILILASVLQYLENPYDVLSELLYYKYDVVLIDRTMVSQKSDRICVQRVPSTIYKASYPCRILNEKRLLDFFEVSGYSLVESFESIGWRTSSFEFNGYVFRLRQ